MSRNAWIAIVAVGLLAGAAGWLTATWTERPAAPGAASGPCPGGAEPLYWKAPMDPTYVRKEPGKSPMGMDLVPVCPGEGGAQANEKEVRVSPVVVQDIGVKTAPVQRRTLSRKIRTLGRVAYDERLVSHVHTKVQGWVEKLNIDYEGQMVQKGEGLLEVYSPALVSTQEELLLAARYREQTDESTFGDVSEGGRALFDATRRRLELFDIPDRDIEALLRTGKVRKTLTLYAPSSGVVTHMMVREGMEVGPNDNLYTIADLSHVWIYADVYEYELPWVEKGQLGIAELSYLPGRTFEARVSYVYPFLDPKTRTARVRLELDNPDLLFKPDMYANVTIEAATRPNALVVPEDAVIRSGTRSLVIVALGEGRFEPRSVELGLDSGDGWIEITRGLQLGETVVTSGQFLIDSESKLQEAVEAFLAPKPATGTSPAPDARDRQPGGGHEGHAPPGDAGR
jgi:multidrug efflux pump subunit AcrA (membrane-fusion protein)